MKEKRFPLPGGKGEIGISIMPVTKQQVLDATYKSICGFMAEACATPESDHFAMVPVKRMLEDNLPVDEVMGRLVKELSPKYEIYQDSDTLYLIHGDIGRERCLKEMLKQEEAIKELLAELHTTAILISRGHHDGLKVREKS